MSNNDKHLSVEDVKKIAGMSNLEVIHSKNKRVMVHTLLTRALNTLSGMNRYLLHYQTGNEGGVKIGHWCALAVDSKNKEVLFFDPLGLFPDNQQNLISQEVREETDQVQRHIGKCLHDLQSHNFKIYYNEIPFQKSGANTCGRYCGAVLLLSLKRIIQPKELEDLLHGFKRPGESYDDCIINITQNMIK